jgi:N-ethylmaleimide reductase
MSVTGNREDNILSTPTKLGAVSLGHRVVMSPLTRSRAEQPGDIQEYYSQRASEGGLITSAGNAPIDKRP